MNLILQRLDFQVVLVFEILGIWNSLNRVEEQGKLLLKHLVLHHVELPILLHHEDLVVLAVNFTQLFIELVLAAPAHIVIKLRHLPNGISIGALHFHEGPQLVKLVDALFKLALEDIHLLLLLHVLQLEGFEFSFKLLGHFLLSLERTGQLRDFIAHLAKRVIQMVWQFQFAVDVAALNKSLLLAQAAAYFGAGCILEHRQHKVLHNLCRKLWRDLVKVEFLGWIWKLLRWNCPIYGRLSWKLTSWVDQVDWTFLACSTLLFLAEFILLNIEFWILFDLDGWLMSLGVADCLATTLGNWTLGNGDPWLVDVWQFFALDRDCLSSLHST